MFLLSVTRQSIAPKIAAPAVREFASGPWLVTVATDDWLSFCTADAEAVTAREAPPFAREPASELTFNAASFSLRDHSVELLKTPLSGRFFFYHLSAGGELFCASHAGLLRAAGVVLEEDPKRLPELLTYRYVTAPRTLFRNVDQLQAGQRLRFRFDGTTWRQAESQLFSPPLPVAAGNGGGTDGLYGAFGERTTAALRASLGALRPAGEAPQVLLSGGLDSSILYRLANQELGVTESYSAGYPFVPAGEDVEQRYAASAAEALGARHRLHVPTTRQFLRGFVEAAALMDEPVVHLQSVLILLTLRDGTPQDGHAGVVMGEGADGAFGLKVHERVRKLVGKGRSYAKWRPLLGSTPALALLRPATRLFGRGVDFVRAMESRWDADDPVADPRHVVWWMHAVCDGAWARRKFGATFDDAAATRAGVIKPFQGRPVYDLMSLMSFMSDASTVQRQWSRLAEAAGKWAYYPFHHRGVLESAYSAPWDVKLAEPKALLRGAARAIGVPELIITRPKADFSAASRSWAAPGGALDPLIPLAAKAWDERELRQMQSRFAGSTDYASGFTFLALLQYAIWKRLFFEGEPLSTLLDELERAVFDRPILGGAAPAITPTGADR